MLRCLFKVTGSFALAVMTCTVVALPATAQAQNAATSPTKALDEIIVTARKREESVQTVPQTIEVLSGGTLADLGKNTFKDLQFEVPGFYVENYETRATITMRGVGAQVAGNGAAVATHVNGIFQASTAASLGWLFDVDRVEVLKGPQGTLYGRNSTGGAVDVITRKPGHEFDGGFSLNYGRYGTTQIAAGGDLPVTDDWSLRLAGAATRGEGRLTNVITGRKVGDNDFTGGRLTLAGKAGSVDVDLFVQVTNEKGGTGQLIPLNPDGSPMLGWDRTSMDNPAGGPQLERDAYLAGLTLSGALGNGFSWRSVSGYLHYREPQSFLDVNPIPGAPVQLTIAFPQYARQISQELALLYDGDRLNGVIGVLYMNEFDGETRFLDIVPVLSGALNSATDNHVRTTALFADMNYKFSDHWRLNVGLRANNDKVRNKYVGQGIFDGESFDLRSSQSEPTGRIGLDYTTEAGAMYYGSISKGFQAGFNDVGFDANGAPAPATVKPEKLTAFELGMKLPLPGNFGYFDLAGFYYDYRDMQVFVGSLPMVNGVPDPNGVPFFTTLNAGKARIYGADVSLSGMRATEHLRFDLDAEYLNAKYKEYNSIDDFGAPVDFAGNTLPRAPKFSSTVAMTFDKLPIGAAQGSLRLEYQYRSNAYDKSDNIFQLGSVGLVNALASVELPGGKWRLKLAARNLTDKKYFAFYDGRDFGQPGAFRTWSVGFSYNYD